MVNGAEFVVSERETFTPEPKTQSLSLRALYSRDFIKVKVTEKVSSTKHLKQAVVKEGRRVPASLV